MLVELMHWIQSVLTTPQLLLPFIVGLAVMGMIVILFTHGGSTSTITNGKGDDFYSEYQRSVLLKKLNE